MNRLSDASIEIYFTDFFEVPQDTLAEYGAFNVSLVNDLPLFIDPFLLFNSEREDYQRLHEQIIDYLRFLRDKSVEGYIEEGLLKSWFTFSEVKQNWLGFSESGNAGSGLGLDFARALNRNLNLFFTNFGYENVTKGSHLEKLTLIESGVGRDNISDFTTNLIKEFLLDYTQTFAKQHVRPELRRRVTVQKVRFNYATQVWENESFDLPWDGDDYVLLTPKNMLTKDENWINRYDLIRDYDDVVASVPDYQLRAQVNNYFATRLPKDYNHKEKNEARNDAILRFPELIEYYIRYKEEHGEEAEASSDQKVTASEQLYIEQVRNFVGELLTSTGFYGYPGNTYEEVHARVMYLKDVIENKGGHRLFYANDEPIRREKDLQILFRLRGSASRLWSAARSPLPTVVSPALADEPAHGNDNPGEGKPKIYDRVGALSTPHQLLVGVLPRVRALYHPPLSCC